MKTIKKIICWIFGHNPDYYDPKIWLVTPPHNCLRCGKKLDALWFFNNGIK